MKNTIKNIKNSKFTTIMLTIFVVFSVVGFAYPLFATGGTSTANFGGNSTANNLLFSDFSVPLPVTDANLLEGGHFQVPTRGSMLGYLSYPGSKSLITPASASTTAQVIFVTPNRRRVGMMVTVLDDDPTFSGDTGYSIYPLASHIVTYRLAKNRASDCTTTVADNSLDGIGTACATTQLSDWQVVIPEMNLSTVGHLLQIMVDGSGNYYMGVSSSTGSGTATSGVLGTVGANQIAFGLSDASGLTHSSNFTFTGGNNPTFTVGGAATAGNGTVFTLNDSNSLITMDGTRATTLFGATTTLASSTINGFSVLSGNTYNGVSFPSTFTVTVTATGTLNDVFTWTDGIVTATGVSMSSSNSLIHGVIVGWTTTTGHTIGDSWTWQYSVSYGGTMFSFDGQNRLYQIGNITGAGNNTKISIDDVRRSIFLTGNILTSTTSGLVSLGNGAFTGTTTGTFFGSASGTQFAINTATGFTGNIFDFQNYGISKMKLDASGAVTIASLATSTSGLCVTVDSNGKLGLGACGGGGGGIVTGGTFNNTQVIYGTGTSTVGGNPDFVFTPGTNPLFSVGDLQTIGNKTFFTLNDSTNSAVVGGNKVTSEVVNAYSGTLGTGTTSDVTFSSISFYTGLSSDEMHVWISEINASYFTYTSGSGGYFQTGEMISNGVATGTVVSDSSGTSTGVVLVSNISGIISTSTTFTGASSTKSAILASFTPVADMFNWSDNVISGGPTSIISGTPILLRAGISATFASSTGHTVGSSGTADWSKSYNIGYGSMLSLDGAQRIYSIGDISSTSTGNRTNITINDTQQTIYFNGNAYTTAQRGLVSIGNGGFSGGAGNFNGSASGTQLAVNVASSTFFGNLLDLQVGGMSKFSVDVTGAVTISNFSGTSTAGRCIVVSASGTLLLADCASSAGLLGGTTPYVYGDMFFANGTSTLGRISLGKVGQVLMSTGTSTPPQWMSLTASSVGFSIGGTGLGIAIGTRSAGYHACAATSTCTLDEFLTNIFFPHVPVITYSYIYTTANQYDWVSTNLVSTVYSATTTGVNYGAPTVTSFTVSTTTISGTPPTGCTLSSGSFTNCEQISTNNHIKIGWQLSPGSAVTTYTHPWIKHYNQTVTYDTLNYTTTITLSDGLSTATSSPVYTSTITGPSTTTITNCNPSCVSINTSVSDQGDGTYSGLNSAPGSDITTSSVSANNVGAVNIKVTGPSGSVSNGTVNGLGAGTAAWTSITSACIPNGCTEYFDATVDNSSGGTETDYYVEVGPGSYSCTACSMSVSPVRFVKFAPLKSFIFIADKTAYDFTSSTYTSNSLLSYTTINSLSTGTSTNSCTTLTSGCFATTTTSRFVSPTAFKISNAGTTNKLWYYAVPQTWIITDYQDPSNGFQWSNTSGGTSWTNTTNVQQYPLNLQQSSGALSVPYYLYVFQVDGGGAKSGITTPNFWMQFPL